MIAKEKFANDHAHNILILFGGWANFSLTTNETERDY